ncbi:DNA-directed RNA polymerase I subunit rpa49 [Balamuthia mandrillaris]
MEQPRKKKRTENGGPSSSAGSSKKAGAQPITFNYTPVEDATDSVYLGASLPFFSQCLSSMLVLTFFCLFTFFLNAKASFPNGPPPLSSLNNSAAGLHFTAWQEDKRARAKRILVAESEKMLYTNQEQGRSLNKYFVGVYHKPTGTVKLVDASQIYSMQQRIKGFKPKLPGSSSSEARDNREQRRQLVEQFGSRKNRTQVHSAQANAISVDSISKKDSIADIIKQRAFNNDHASGSALRSDLPPYNETTEEPSEIYPLDNMVPPSILADLDAQDFLEASSNSDKLLAFRQSTDYSEFVLRRLSALKEVANKGKRDAMTTAQLLKLVHHFMTFRRFAVGQRRAFSFVDAATSCPYIPEALVRFLLSQFMECIKARKVDRYKFPKASADKLINYILILCLHVDDYETDSNLIASDLKLPPDRCALHFMSLGCKKLGPASKRKRKEGEGDEVGRSAGAVRLVAPLTFMEQRKRRSKAK